MVHQRQRLARKRFREDHPELIRKPEPRPPKDSGDKKKSKFKRNRRKEAKGPKSLDKTKQRTFRKHPLRVPGMKPGESCFICKSKDHIAKLCPQKAEWERHKTCLLCRQRGHSLKNCPNKGDDSMEKKFCYNCGETGHTLSKCSQPLQDGGTKFASCFVCNEHGHLSKNCPKNTRGIYPKGGCCKICGGVTHLAKDCPNKGNRSSVAINELDKTSSEYGEWPRMQVTKFESGDTLDDDFLEEKKSNNTNKAPISQSKETNGPVQPRKKKGPKVVNFVG